MPSQKNVDQLMVIKEKLAKAQNLIIADYAGLNSAAQTELRAKIKAAGGEFAVTKNRLIALALKERLNDLPEDLTKALEGPNATLYAFTDAVTATKVLVDFAKDHDNLKIKMGVMVGQEGQADTILTTAAIKNLATLPSRDQLLGQVVGTLNAPIVGFVNVLAGNLRGLVQVLNAIKDKNNN